MNSESMKKHLDWIAEDIAKGLRNQQMDLEMIEYVLDEARRIVGQRPIYELDKREAEQGYPLPEYAKEHMTKEEWQELVEQSGMGMISTEPGVKSTTSKTGYGIHENVWLDAEEIEKLKNKYLNSDEMIEMLSKFKFDKKKEYVSDYAALLLFGMMDGQIR